MKTEPIIFKQGEENGIVIERENLKSSIFADQYQQAVDLFARLWERQKSFQQQAEDCKPKVYGIDNQFSNIIAFCGDRGEGKTSSMISFATLLTDSDVREKAKEALVYPLDKSGKEMLPSSNEIEWLDVIDPSFFDEQHNILELMLGQLYAKASEISIQSNESQRNEIAYKRRKLMEQFQIVKNSIHLLECDDKLYDSISEMSDLSASIQLKSAIQKLFKCYLDYINKKCLLICIDDIDLNIQDAYRMSEMLRKYFISPYCIVLVAVKVEQLVEVVAKHHEDVFKLSPESSLQIARKHVAKLLPRGNRVVMPVAEDFCEQELQIADQNGNIDSKEPVYTIKEKVVQMIFQKTGYVFYNTQHLSPIIPRNLRSLRHLLGLLSTLPDARDENWDDDETGRETFKDYFFGTWATQRLSEKDYTFAHQLAYYDDLSTMNAFVVEHFAKRVRDDEKIEIENTDVKDEYIKLYRNIVSNQNTAANISYGDVMYVLWLINGITLRPEIQNLIFFIKTVYSMRLYACYNVISQGPEFLYPPVPEVEKVVHIHRAETLYAHVNQLQRLINGSYFTYPQGVFLPKNDEKGGCRDKKPIPFGNVISGLKELRKAYNNNDVRKTEGFRKQLLIFEILALCISRTVNEKEQLEDMGYNRIEKIPTFLGALSSSANYAIFDFLLPLYSLCNIEYAYNRFNSIMNEAGSDDSLYDIAKTTKDSLLSQLLALSKKKKEWEQKHYLISDAVIRIADVQWAIYDELIRTKDIHKNGDASMVSAYNKITELKIKLFPLIRKDNNTNHKAHILKFESIAKLSEIIKEVAWDNLNKYLYIPREVIVQDDVNTFMNNFIAAVTLMPNRPISGAEIKALILEEATLTDKQKASLTARLGHMFKTREMYPKDHILSNAIAIQTIYKAAKKK